ncbi:MAG: SAM-dependent methyltransferase, partial [Mycobacterium sp.]|nr:SAM-dependent methyltransferase [Mycobacterium sp.]
MSGHPRGRKAKPGRITFVGSGPGDPGLLTTRARTVLANASCVFTDPDVGEAVLRLVGTDLPPAVGPAPEGASAPGGDQTAPPVVQVGPDIRPALGEPADVAKTLIAEAKAGADVVRLVAGDPLSLDSVTTEVM